MTLLIEVQGITLTAQDKLVKESCLHLLEQMKQIQETPTPVGGRIQTQDGPEK